MSSETADSAGTSEKRGGKAARIRELMAAEGDAVAENTRGFNAGRYESTGRLDDYEELKAEAREIKEDAIARLPELIEEVKASVEANGGAVYEIDLTFIGLHGVVLGAADQRVLNQEIDTLRDELRWSLSPG